MVYERLMTKDALAQYLDVLVNALMLVHRKTGTIADAPDRVMSTMTRWVESPDCFLLIALDEEANYEFQGFLFAFCVRCAEPWVEVVSMWSPPRVATQVKDVVFAKLKAWTKEQGADRIIAIVTRNPDVFYEFFYKPLGFHPIGMVMEVKVDATPNAG